MVSTQRLGKDVAEQRSRKILDCAERILQLLKQRAPLPDAFTAEIELNITNLLPLPTVQARTARSFDELGTQIWNASESLAVAEATDDTGVQKNKLSRKPVLVRLFAYFLLETSCNLARTITLERRIRLLKTAIKTSQTCIHKGQHDLALRALEGCSKHVDTITATGPYDTNSTELAKDESDVPVLRRLVIQYVLLRLLYAWKIDRLDLAEHFYQRLERDLDGTRMTEPLSQQAADLLYEIARSLAEKSLPGDAIVWFERGFSVLKRDETDCAHLDQEELLVTVGVSYAEALLATTEAKHHRRASEVIEELDRICISNHRIAVDVLKLRLLAVENSKDENEYRTTLARICKIPFITEKNFNLIMHNMRAAAQVCLPASIVSLRDFIVGRLLTDGQLSGQDQESLNTWLEKATIAFIIFATSAPSDLNLHVDSEIYELLDSIYQRTQRLFSGQATHAAQALIWKYAGKHDTPLNPAWADVLRHQIFENAGHVNKGRIARRIMSLALASGDFPAARQAFFHLPVAIRNENSTRYLAFKMAVHSGELGLAEECLRIVAQGSARDPTYLYACVLEAQHFEVRRITITALQMLLDKRPSGVHLASLLRCTARLLVAEMDSAQYDANIVLDSALTVFETAANSLTPMKRIGHSQWQEEIQWWSKVSYNLAIQICASVHPRSLVRFLSICRSFLDSFPNDAELQQRDKLQYRRCMCSFLATTALIAFGRSSIAEAEAVRAYLDAQQYIKDFRQLFSNILTGSNNGKDSQVHHKAFQMLKFELECALKLQQWESIDSILTSFLECSAVEKWDTLVGLLIFSHGEAHLNDKATERMVQLLHRIITETFDGTPDFVKLSRWLRFAFSLSLEHQMQNFAFDMARRAAEIAEGGQKGRRGKYPEAELHWLASSCFNEAIDRLGQGHVDDAMAWVDKSLELARWADDEGALHSMLTSRKAMVQDRLREREQMEL